MLAAMAAVDAGISPETIDEAMLAFGMPMGPIELIDSVGLDIALAAGKQLAGGAEPPRCLLEQVKQGQLGKPGRAFTLGPMASRANLTLVPCPPVWRCSLSRH